MPSPVEDRPGLLIRDPFQYSDSTLIVPPLLVPGLRCFDGQQTDLELRAALTESTGDLRVGQIAKHLHQVLDEAGFLDNERLQLLKSARHSEFAAGEKRIAAHAGAAYPDDGDELRALMDQYMEEAPAALPEQLVGIAAPHVSPAGGWRCYRDAFASLRGLNTDPVFVILGTSHFGEPDRFGLTRKPFVTPFGEARTETALVDWLEKRAPRSILMEDYCHAVEHSIEFQVVFLQSVFGAGVRVLPILCGSFARCMYEGNRPESNDEVRAFLDALAELHSQNGKKLCWVLGVDMAHVGARYGDQVIARANEGHMQEVAERDQARIRAIERGSAADFWSLVEPNQDDLKWCGSSPIYTFLKAVAAIKGRSRRYEQWNIDDQSVVSFAAIDFTA